MPTSDSRLQALFKQPQALPSAPEVAARLIATFGQDDVDVVAVARDIDRDPVMAAKVLQRANSAFFRLLRPVSTSRDALMVLGLNKVRALVINTALNDCFHAVGTLNLDRYWHHSLVAATLARYIAYPLRMDENLAFTAGLLHGIGELVLHAGLPEAMTEIDRELDLLDPRRAAMEQQVLGFSHADAGAELARRWHFPQRLVDALAQQVSPLEAPQPEPLAALVHLAVWRACIHGTPGDADRLIHTYPDALGLAMGLDHDVLVTEDVPPLRELEAS